MPSEEILEVRDLGVGVDYLETLKLQEELVMARYRNEIPNTLLLLEHSPVYTIGRTKDKSSLLNPELLPYPVHEISRGGQATYHGPGQLVGYLIVDLRPLGRDLAVYLRSLENALINTCAEFGVQAQQREGLTGIWVENQKLASIGIGVKKWITYHGFGLNFSEESLPPFNHITPCGLGGVSMTCMSKKANNSVSIDILKETLAKNFLTMLEKLSSEKTANE